MPLSSAEIDRRMDLFSQACRQSGTRMTHQRMEIFREVARSRQHPDAQSVFGQVRRRIPQISLNTVYRTLAFLEDRELIMRVDAHAERAHYDGDTGQHPHFLCSKCGTLRDCRIPPLDELQMPSQIPKLGRISSWQVQVRGVCAKCLSAIDEQEQSS